MTHRLAALSVAFAAGLFGASVAISQSSAPQRPSFPQPPYRNLQVFPATITADQLMWNMRFFSQSLGVRCGHCHVAKQDGGFDFASDANPEKPFARKMLQMTHRINQHDFAVTDFKDAKVTCFTCHRGARKPATMPPEAPAAAAPGTRRPQRG